MIRRALQARKECFQFLFGVLFSAGGHTFGLESFALDWRSRTRAVFSSRSNGKSLRPIAAMQSAGKPETIDGALTFFLIHSAQLNKFREFGWGLRLREQRRFSRRQALLADVGWRAF